MSATLLDLSEQPTQQEELPWKQATLSKLPPLYPRLDQVSNLQIPHYKFWDIFCREPSTIQADLTCFWAVATALSATTGSIHFLENAIERWTTLESSQDSMLQTEEEIQKDIEIATSTNKLPAFARAFREWAKQGCDASKALAVLDMHGLYKDQRSCQIKMSETPPINTAGQQDERYKKSRHERAGSPHRTAQESKKRTRTVSLKPAEARHHYNPNDNWQQPRWEGQGHPEWKQRDKDDWTSWNWRTAPAEDAATRATDWWSRPSQQTNPSSSSSSWQPSMVQAQHLQRNQPVSAPNYDTKDEQGVPEERVKHSRSQWNEYQ